MKKFTTEEIRTLLGQVVMGEISFSQMTEVLNERMSEGMSGRMEEMNEPQYKDGDFVINMAGDILIFREKVGDSIYDHAYLTNYLRLFIGLDEASTTRIDRHTTEEEKQRMLNALAKEGKRWNEEKKCVEDIHVRKFKVGDKVRIKEGISSKTHSHSSCSFIEDMDKYIGQELVVDEVLDHTLYGIIYTMVNDLYTYAEDWLEPYVEELKKGDLAIFWDDNKDRALIRIYNIKGHSHHSDSSGHLWENAIKFESKEQFNRFIKGEI